MAACRSTSEWKLPRRMRLRVRAEKNVSTAFSHEPEVGVKWNAQRVSTPLDFSSEVPIENSPVSLVTVQDWRMCFSVAVLGGAGLAPEWAG